MTYNPSIPAAGRSGSQDYSPMQQNFSIANTSFGVDHTSFVTGGATAGFHQKSTYAVQGSDPTPVANAGIVYTKTAGGTQQLFFENSVGILQLTGNAVNDGSNATVQSQFTVVTSSGMVLKFGLTQMINSGVQVTLPSGFPTTFIGVTVTPRLIGFAQSGANINGPTTTLFTQYQSTGGPQVMYYFAWGM